MANETPANQPSARRPPPTPLVVTVPIAALALGVDESTIRRMRDRNQIKVVKYGGSVRVPVTELARLSAIPLDQVTLLLRIGMPGEGPQ